MTLAAYDAGPECVAYVEFVGVGDSLPEMPLFLRPEFYVPAPLEATYRTAWAMFPAALSTTLSDLARFEPASVEPQLPAPKPPRQAR